MHPTNAVWQLDIFDLARYQYFNKDYKYLLVVIDVFSRKAYAEPMIIENSVSIKEAFIKMTKIVQPKTIMSDHEPTALGNEISEYLREKQIPLNMNALGDQHLLVIIDKFAGRIKRISTAMSS